MKSKNIVDNFYPRFRFAAISLFIGCASIRDGTCKLKKIIIWKFKFMT
ncbi:MAG: hypothetical protein AVDCRST_MAG96-3945 [uncultured Segetibacter sp.]|uniref:Uncharacterized protein n=1 Tax=uncultured Segetibacter sp. TaxID=481133 RepID=A0A6J4U1L8_9BACT|nr:MAG: hypothetical protein AVDCRST_MAG96-3945 [uncultured Segetibacter sp.]